MAILEKKAARSRLDLAQARKMQEAILPKKSKLEELEKRMGLKVTSHSESCEITGGDFWGIEEISCEHVAFYMIDCSGHGFSAALNTFRLHAVIDDIDNMYTRLIPSNFMSLLNHKMCNLMPAGQFATMFYGVINIKKHNMVYATASATKPIIISRSGKIKVLDGSGFPLGATEDAEFPSRHINFKKGDRLVLYSDALTEAINAKGKMFGEERLVEMFSKNSKMECSELIKRIIARQQKYRHGGLQDDLTLNIYRRL